MSVNLGTLIDAAVSHALTTGRFEKVNGYEPKSAPGYGLTAAVWVQNVASIQGSGLDQYQQPGRQVILYPPEYRDGELMAPFAK